MTIKTKTIKLPVKVQFPLGTQWLSAASRPLKLVVDRGGYFYELPSMTPFEIEAAAADALLDKYRSRGAREVPPSASALCAKNVPQPGRASVLRPSGSVLALRPKSIRAAVPAYENQGAQ